MTINEYQIISFSTLFDKFVKPFICIAIFMIIILVSIFFLIKYVNAPKSNTNKSTILIFEFDGPSTEQYAITDIIIHELRQATEDAYNNIEVKYQNRVITPKEGSKKARSIGKIQKAMLVLWGWFRTIKETIRT